MPEGYLPLLMFMAGVALVAWILMRRGFVRGGRRKAFDSRPIDAQPRPATEWSGAYTDSAALVERQKVELAEFSREANGQIDTKILVLRELMRQSEQQIDQMQRLLDELKQVSARR
jgi:hypothetical protein